MQLFDRVIAARGLNSESVTAFLSPSYESLHDPFLLPDMTEAVDRLVDARKKQEKIVIYGDYDIDGLTSTALLLDAFKSFGYENVSSIIPSRFTDGYGLTIDAVDKIAKDGAQLIVTVDCGSLSEKEIIHAKNHDIDTIVTDHHNVASVQPPAIAVVNPKRKDNKYPFVDLAGVGVAFKLVQALQTRLDGLPKGYEKWLLDLVALGTVCDVVSLLDENRIFVHWGLIVMSQTKRIGLKSLIKVADVSPNRLNARSLGFALGPRMNAAGRLETAQYALDMLTATDFDTAVAKAERLNDMNIVRRVEQDKITKEAITQSEKYQRDFVLVLSSADWNNGIVGIVASKILEKYKKPVFILQEVGAQSRGSARSYGDFSVADAVCSCDDIITSGGGHKLAAGVSLPTKNIGKFRKRVNEYYSSLGLSNQKALLLPIEDTVADLEELTQEVVNQISQLEPFGNGNQQPILKTNGLTVKNVRTMGANGQHVKLDLQNDAGKLMQFVAFNAQDYLYANIGDKVDIWYRLNVNEWQGCRSVEGELLHLEVACS